MTATHREKFRRESEEGKRFLHEYAKQRRDYHLQNSLTQGGWVGDYASSTIADELAAYFGFELPLLSQEQENLLKFDILNLKGEFSQNAVSKKAREDKKTITKLLANFKEQQSKIENLSSSFFLFQALGLDAKPDISLAKTIYDLEEYLRAAELTLIEIAKGKGNLDTKPLCRAAFTVFLRWVDSPTGRLDRGISETPHKDEFLVLPMVDGNFTSELGVFIETLQDSLVSKGFENWDFSPFKPSQAVLRELKRIK